MNKYIVNKDKLRICYTTSKENFISLAETKSMMCGGYRLTALETENTMLAIDFPSDDAGEWQRIATIQLGNAFTNLEDSETDEHYVWIDVVNSVLYPKDNYHNLLSYLDPITTELGLKPHNITALDICLDTNRKDMVRRFKKGIKKFVPIIFNKAYEDKEEVIKPLLYISQTNRIKITSESVYIDNAEKTCALRLYNKSKEIAEESHKDYISDLYEGEEFWRTEIRLKHKEIKKYLEARGMSADDLYGSIVVLQDEKVLFDMFCFFMWRIIHFRDESGNPIILYELPR